MSRRNQAQGEYISIEKLKEWVEKNKIESWDKVPLIDYADLLEYINKK